MRKLGIVIAVAGIVLTIVVSCSNIDPVDIDYGEDRCDWCEEVIEDKRFGSGMVLKDGDVLRFNSIECMMAFHLHPTVERETFMASFVSDYNNPGDIVRAGLAFFVHTDRVESPKGAGLFAFSSEVEANAFADQHNGDRHEWDELPPYVREVFFPEEVEKADTPAKTDSVPADTGQ